MSKRTNSFVDYASLSLNIAIGAILDNTFSGIIGSFDCVVETLEGWFRIDGYREVDGTGFGCAYSTSPNNLASYSFVRRAGADAVLKKLGELVFQQKSLSASRLVEESDYLRGNYYQTGITGKELFKTIFFTISGIYPFGGGSVNPLTGVWSYNSSTGELYLQSSWCHHNSILVFYAEN